MMLIVSFLVALLVGSGVGGGGLFVLFLTLAARLPQKEAQGLNLLFFLAAAGAAFAVNRSKRHFSLSCLLPLAVSGVLFSVAGALAARHADVGLLRRAFGILMILSGVLTFFHGLRKNGERDSQK